MGLLVYRSVSVGSQIAHRHSEQPQALIEAILTATCGRHRVNSEPLIHSTHCMRVDLYARVSTEKQELQQTIQSQTAALEDYAKQQGQEIVDRYIDDGWTGSVLARPALDRLRDDAARRLFDGVLIHSPDRLARTYVHQEVLIEELKKAGSQIIFLNRPLADTPEDRMLQGMQGLFAEYEKAKIAERFRRGKLHKARSGRIVGHMAP